ncbi:MAG: beta-glucosidase [Hyphomonadaceae bacterium]|nr:beta-glucosidase [Hyphomonadaceae bacterium]
MTTPIFPLHRRAVLAGLGAVSLAAASGCAPAAAPMPAPKSRQFPEDFIWGAASAAYQIEGALDADGRGESVWDVFARIDGKIVDHSLPAIACDSYRRYAEDAALLSGASLKNYRFSIAWPRVQPTGAGAANDKGLDYYSRLADALLAQGVTPWATLFHWDLPQALQANGGWANRDIAERFADYAGVIAAKLGDRVKNFIVLNEAAVHAVLGHVTGEHAPGLKDASLLGPVIHHENLAQGRAIQALRAARNDLRIGTTLALMPSRAEGGVAALANRPAAEGFDALWNGAFLDPLLRGAYPEGALATIGAALQADDLAITKQPVDFIGVNYYSPAYIKLDLSSPSRIAAGAPPADTPRDAFGREIDPSGLYEMLERLRTQYENPLVYITENGCSDPFSNGPAVIEDGFRIDYLRKQLEAVRSAMEAGGRIGGYFHWSLIDNWEWALGFTSKFGLVGMNRDTGLRTPKASYAWMKALAESGLLDAAA